MDNNYTEFTALDFAQEPSFIRWVRNPDNELSAFWEGWLSEHPGQRQDMEQARRMVSALHFKEEEPSRETLDSIWGRIDSETEKESVPEKIISRRIVLRRILSYAAAASVALILFFYFNNPTKVVNTTNAQQLALDLPDGSRVQVNAATEISYQPKKWGKERRIHLNGEAFFQVEKGEPFIVETAFGSVEVLGTSFNVRARDGNFEVDCFSGKVRVSRQGSVQVLTPGFSTRVPSAGEGLELPFTYDPELTATWRDGRFYFKEARLKEVFTELSRQYDIKIQASPDILNRRTTTFFELGNLDSALYKVCWPMQLTANRKGNVVVVE